MCLELIMMLSNESFVVIVYGIIVKVVDFYGIMSVLVLLKRLNIIVFRLLMGYLEELVNMVLNNNIICDDISCFILSLSNIVMYDECYLKIVYSKKVRVCKICFVEGEMYKEVW